MIAGRVAEPGAEASVARSVRPVQIRVSARRAGMHRGAEGSGGSSEKTGDLFGRVADLLDRLFKLVLR